MKRIGVALAHQSEALSSPCDPHEKSDGIEPDFHGKQTTNP